MRPPAARFQEDGKAGHGVRRPGHGRPQFHLLSHSCPGPTPEGRVTRTTELRMAGAEGRNNAASPPGGPVVVTVVATPAHVAVMDPPVPLLRPLLEYRARTF